MAAPFTVPQHPPSHQSVEQLPRLMPRHGVVMLSGYGVAAHVDRGHLVLRDGAGTDRREARLSRVGHGLRRLVVIGADGMVSLGALRWLTDQKAAFTLIDRDGRVLVSSGANQAAAGRLRRAQAVALQTGAAVPIVRMLIDHKLAGQERLARDGLRNASAAGIIASERAALRSADTTEAIRWIEARAGLAYWSAWHDLQILFPKSAIRRVPAHWRTFGARRSPLTGSPRLAVNPPNAMLNYLYALLESEARIAAIAVGLDPSLGLLHADTDARDSLACDLMEPIRPAIDAYVLDWLTREPVRREWFFERRDGSCRLMASFAGQLAETMPVWARAVAPVAERVAEMLWTTIPRSRPRSPRRATPLTQRHRREAKGVGVALDTAPPSPPRVCHGCGVILRCGEQHCSDCHRAVLSETFESVLEEGRPAAQQAGPRARRSASQRRHGQARSAWKASLLPAWLTSAKYAHDIQPRLAAVTTAAIARTLSVSESYAAQIRAGKKTPHPRHWVALAGMIERGHPKFPDSSLA